jgi:hypothetical protein
LDSGRRTESAVPVVTSSMEIKPVNREHQTKRTIESELRMVFQLGRLGRSRGFVRLQVLSNLNVSLIQASSCQLEVPSQSSEHSLHIHEHLRSGKSHRVDLRAEPSDFLQIS